MIVLACLACAICSFSITLTSSLVIATVSLAAAGAGWVTAWSGLSMIVQLASPRWITGRTISIYSAFTYGGIAGAVAESYSLAIALPWSSGTTLLVGALGLKLPISNRSTSPQFMRLCRGLRMGRAKGEIVLKQYDSPNTAMSLVRHLPGVRQLNALSIGRSIADRSQASAASSTGSSVKKPGNRPSSPHAERSR